MNPTRRKRHFIDAKVQGALLLRTVAHWALFLFGTLTFLTCMEMLLSGYERPVSEQLWRVWTRHEPFLLAAIVMLPAFLYDIIKLSHRFVGPVARVRAELRALAERKPESRITLREKDFWEGLADDFNAALERVQRDRRIAAVEVCAAVEESQKCEEPELVEAER
jgi:hypothetical protein